MKQALLSWIGARSWISDAELLQLAAAVDFIGGQGARPARRRRLQSRIGGFVRLDGGSGAMLGRGNAADLEPAPALLRPVRRAVVGSARVRRVLARLRSAPSK